MPDTKVFISVTLDRSGSMYRIRNDAVGGLNTFVEEQQKEEDDALFMLSTFDHEFGVILPPKLLSEVDAFNEGILVPRGETALYDAIGKTVGEIKDRISEMPAGDRPKQVIMVIVTDGEENASVEFTSETLKELIDGVKKDGWEFLLLCADEETMLDAQRLGAGHTIHVHHHGLGRTLGDQTSQHVSVLRRRDSTTDSGSGPVN